MQLINIEKSDNQKKNLIRKIEKEITLNLDALPKHPKSNKRGTIRKTVYGYNLLNEETEFFQASNVLMLEINFMSTPEPYNKMVIRTYMTLLQKPFLMQNTLHFLYVLVSKIEFQVAFWVEKSIFETTLEVFEVESYIADYLKYINENKAIKEYELEDFQIRVLDYKRTFVEKIFSVMDASFQDDFVQKLIDKIRHIFDLYKLYNIIEIQSFFNSDYFFEMSNKVIKENDLFGSVHSKETFYAKSRLFNINILDNIKGAYEYDFRQLVIEELPEFELIKTNLAIIMNKMKYWEENHRTYF